MNCKSCGRSLLGIKPGPCPGCGTAFRPSDFKFAPGSVRFCCPHCFQAYAGTGPRGDLIPRRFVCVGQGCGREIDMDEMIVTASGPDGAPGQPGQAFPPVNAAPLIPEKRTWPAAIGIISISLGALAGIQSVFGLFTPLIATLFKGFPMPPGQPNPFDAMTKYMYWLMPVYVLGIAVAALLIIAGVGLIKRRPWSVTAVFAWAIAKMVYAVIISIVTAMVQKAQMDSMMASPAMSGRGAPPPAFMSGMGTFIAAFTLVFSILWLSAYPIFILVWFTRKGVKQETESWRAGSIS